jgi:hypothetical protein
VPETAKPSQDTAKPPGAPLVAQEKDVEPSSDDKVVVHQLQVVTIILEYTGGQVKSLRLEQKSIDSIEQGELAENPPLEHVCQDEKKGKDAHKANGGKGHGKQRTRRLKLSFEELLAKYEKIGEANIANQQKKVPSSKLPLTRKSQEWNWQGDRSHTAVTYSPFEQPIPMSNGSQSVYFHPYSSWGWFDQEAHVPSYFRPQYIEYVAPRHSERSSSCKDHFDQNRSGAQPKKKVVKQVYRVKYDG